MSPYTGALKYLLLVFCSASFPVLFIQQKLIRAQRPDMNWYVTVLILLSSSDRLSVWLLGKLINVTTKEKKMKLSDRRIMHLQRKLCVQLRKLNYGHLFSQVNEPILPPSSQSSQLRRTGILRRLWGLCPVVYGRSQNSWGAPGAELDKECKG